MLLMLLGSADEGMHLTNAAAQGLKALASAISGIDDLFAGNEHFSTLLHILERLSQAMKRATAP